MQRADVSCFVLASREYRVCMCDQALLLEPRVGTRSIYHRSGPAATTAYASTLMPAGAVAVACRTCEQPAAASFDAAKDKEELKVQQLGVTQPRHPAPAAAAAGRAGCSAGANGGAAQRRAHGKRREEPRTRSMLLPCSLVNEAVARGSAARDMPYAITRAALQGLAKS